MAKINVKGVDMYLYTGDATTTDVIPTAISDANPAVVTVADVTGIAEGMPVSFSGTDFEELDDQLFVVGTVDGGANTFEVLGADTSDSEGVLGSSPLAMVYTTTERVKVCLSSIEIAAPTVNQVDTSTFCSESTMAGRATPGQITLGGYVEKDSDGFAEIQAADDDGLERPFLITTANDNGYFLGMITLAGLGWGIPLEGAISFTVTGSQTQKIKYVHN